MLDPETSRAWRRLLREVRENIPIIVRGLASSGKRIPRKVYFAVIRGCKSLTRRTKGLSTAGGRKELVAEISRVRLRSPIYKA